MRLGVQGTSGKRLNSQLLGLLGAGLRFVQLPGDQVAARQPRERLHKFRGQAMLHTIALQDGFGQREIAARHGGLDVGDDAGRCRNRHQAREDQLPEHLH